MRLSSKFIIATAFVSAVSITALSSVNRRSFLGRASTVAAAAAVYPKKAALADDYSDFTTTESVSLCVTNRLQHNLL